MDDGNDLENYEKPRFDVDHQHSKTIENRLQLKPVKEETNHINNIIGSGVFPRPLEDTNKISVSSSTEQEEHQFKPDIDSFVVALLSAGLIANDEDLFVGGKVAMEDSRPFVGGKVA